MTFADVEAIADAVLYEGYVLYPYRASAVKNRFRWQFGVLAPRSPGGDGEPWFSRTECLIDPQGADPDTGHRLLPDVQLAIRIRGLRPRWRRTEAGSAPWLEGASHRVDLPGVDLNAIAASGAIALDIGGVPMRLAIEATAVGRFVRLRLQLENAAPWQPEFGGDRDSMLCHSLVAAHLLLRLDSGRFVSLIDPPADGVDAAAGCTNCHTWPVLVGEPDRASMLLSAPIILSDYPAVAPESRVELCDGTEIDEILSLRILTLTDDEKREARQTDPRARAIVDRVEQFGADELVRLHGTFRATEFFNPRETPPADEACVMIGETRIAKGSRVRLQPRRRADAMDMFLRDQAATVAGVYHDVDDRVHVAVTVDADPGAELYESSGRFFYFDPSELEPLDGSQERR